MADIISRRSALDIIDSELNGWLTNDERLHLEGVAIGIECLPRIDAVPVVRCKDCKFYTEEERWCRRLGLCGAFDKDGYCSHAEREDDGWN